MSIDFTPDSKNRFSFTPDVKPTTFNTSKQALSTSQSLLDKVRAPITQIGQATEGAFNKIGEGVQQTADSQSGGFLQGLGNLFAGAGKIGSGIAGVVSAPFAPLTNPAGGAVQGIADEISNNPEVQKFATSPQGEAVAKGVENIANYNDIFGLAAGAKAAPEAGGLVKQGLENAQSKIAKATEEAAAKAEEIPFEKSIQFARDYTAPKLNPTAKAEAIQQGRYEEPGLLKKAKVTPSAKDDLVAESVHDVISPNKSVSENVDAISQKISQTNQGVREMIATNKLPFNKKQLRSRLNAAKEDNKLIFASDATAERVYNAVVDEFVKHVEKGDTLGLFEARQTFDKIPAIKKLLDSEGLGENVKRQIVLDVRRAANEYVSEQLPENSPYRDALRRESRMIEAISNIAETNAGTIGKNRLQILADEYPLIKLGLGTALGIGTVGAGGALIASSD